MVTPENASFLGYVGIKAPVCYIMSPEIWFMQLESQFALAKISNGKTKFHHTLAVLPEDIACNLNITTEIEYPALKEQVLESLKANNHHLIEQALSAVSLGDKRLT